MATTTGSAVVQSDGGGGAFLAVRTTPGKQLTTLQPSDRTVEEACALCDVLWETCMCFGRHACALGDIHALLGDMP